MKRFVAIVLCSLMMTIPLAGCLGGDEDESTETAEQIHALDEWDVYYVASGTDLPNCNSDIIGRLYFVDAETEFQTCTSNGWTTIDLTGLAGPDGADGQDGADGADGQDGADGADGQDGADGNTFDVSWLDYSDGQLYATCGHIFNEDISGQNFPGFSGLAVDIRYSNFTNSNFSESNWRRSSCGLLNSGFGWWLKSSMIIGSDFSNSDFSGANMIAVAVLYSDFSNVDFSNSNLSLDINTYEHGSDNPSYFENTNLSGAVFASAEMRWIHLTSSNLSYADLTDTILTGAVLDNADLSYADLSYANLGQEITVNPNDSGGKPTRYNYYSTSARNTSFYHASLQNANLSDGNYINADFRFADLKGADLTNATLIGSNFFSANLSEVYWNNTICPDGKNSDDNGFTCENNLSFPIL